MLLEKKSRMDKTGNIALHLFGFSLVKLVKYVQRAMSRAWIEALTD